MRLATLISMSSAWFRNIMCSKIAEPYSMVHYVIDPTDWSIKWDAKYITEKLNSQKLLKARITTTHKGIHTQIIHFGSVHTFLRDRRFQTVNKDNKVVFTWFHVVPDYKWIKHVKEAKKYVDLVHTSSTITRKKLMELDIPEEKIVVVPLGVDLNLFKPASLEEKQRIREEIGIPKDKLVIGSFQKDGIGWGKGLEPKWGKGPDTLVRVADELKKDQEIFLLLLGPARGYVKKELAKRRIPYRHIFLKNYLEVPKYYRALDLYLVTSRVEGGPKALLESMASGVPLVSTRVGMAPDIIKDGYNALLAEVDDVKMLSENALKIIKNKNLANQLANNGFNIIEDYSWERIAKEYYEKIYSKLLR